MVNVYDLLQRKTAASTKAHKLLADATASGKDLKGTALAEYEGLVGEIQDIHNQIAAKAAGQRMPGEPTPVFHVSGESSFQAAQATAVQAATPRNTSLSHQIQAVYTSASSEVKAQIENLTNYIGGRQYDIRADLASSGSVMIPSTVQDIIVRNYTQFDPVRQISKLFTTVSGEATTFPVLNDSEVGAAIAEAASTGADATVSGDTPPTSLTGPQLHAYKTSSKPVFVPRELQEDAFAGGQFAGGVPLIGELLAALVARIIRWENSKFTTGSGSGEQQGFITAATAYHAGAVALDLDIAMDLAYSVPPLYRPNGVYMASDTTIKYLRKLHTGISGDKRALWQNSFQDGNATKGEPPTLHGYPVITNNDMDSVASDGTFASANVLAFGDFSKFLIREVSVFGSNLYTYRYLVPAKDGIGLVCFRRTDSKLLVPTAINKLVV